MLLRKPDGELPIGRCSMLWFEDDEDSSAKFRDARAAAR